MELTTAHTSTQLTVSDYSSIERKQWVLDQYLAGRYPAVVREEYKHIYKLSDASYDKDVTWCNDQLRKKGENELEAIIERHTDRYNFLYNLAVQKGDIRSANQALKQIEDLYKIHKPASNTVAGNKYVQVNNFKMPSMSVEELRQLLGKSHQPDTIDIEPLS
jgi:hypothetical protein